MTEELKEKQLAFLEDTVEHYSVNPVKRRCIVNGQCVYNPKTLKLTESEGCAIGRHLPDEVSLLIDEKGISLALSVQSEFVESRLPENLSELGSNFLRAMQHLHDGDYYWDSKGLSAKGEDKVREIKEKIAQGRYIKYE